MGHPWRRALQLSVLVAFPAARDFGQGRVPCTRPSPAPLGKLLGEKWHVFLAKDFGTVAASSVGYLRWKFSFYSN